MIPRGLAALAAGLAIAGVAARADEVSVTIDPSKRFQTIRGFGASGAWWPNYVADFPEEKRAEMLRLLFTADGAHLSIYRHNLPAGDGPDVTDRVRRTVSVESAPGEYDFDRAEKFDRILGEVRALGVEKFVLFSKSPPPRMLVNGKVSGGPEGGSNLRPDMRDEFADYLLDVSAHLIERYELPEVALSPINEPQWYWGKDRRHQEGCRYTPEELAATFEALVKAKRERGMDIEIQGPESGDWKSADDYVRAMFEVPEIAEEVRTVAVHSYWSTPRDRRRFVEWFRERYPDKALAMTEYCQMERGHGVGMDEALHMLEVMHQDLVVANVESWQWWLGIFTGRYNDALIYAHPRRQTVEPTKRLWAMGNFSRFIRPGAVRFAAEGGGDLRVSAYGTNDGGKLVLVAINPGEETTLKPAVAGADILSLEAFATSADLDLAKLPDAVPDAVTLPARSVTTLVLETNA